MEQHSRQSRRQHVRHRHLPCYWPCSLGRGIRCLHQCSQEHRACSAEGMGSITEWVDDHVFFCISALALTEFNTDLAPPTDNKTVEQATHNRGRRYRADHLPDGSIVECDQDMHFPLEHLSKFSPRSEKEAQFTYGDTPWRTSTGWQPGASRESSKDVPVPFDTIFRYISLEWGHHTS